MPVIVDRGIIGSMDRTHVEWLAKRGQNGLVYRGEIVTRCGRGTQVYKFTSDLEELRVWLCREYLFPNSPLAR